LYGIETAFGCIYKRIVWYQHVCLFSVSSDITVFDDISYDRSTDENGVSPGEMEYT